MQSFVHPAVDLAKKLTFKAFIQAEPIQKSIQGNPSASYVTDRAGVEHCHQFVRLEHFNEGIRPFEKHLGFSLGEIQRTNTSPRDADYRGYDTDAGADIVARICATDISRFGYEF